MGHAEMQLAVAGLNELQAEEKTRLLASGDWSSLSPQQRVILHFARKLSKEPKKLDEADMQTMIRHLGADRALDWTYHVCWANFMTRVADAFQLPLESTNVFMPPERKKPPTTDAPDAKTGGTLGEQPKPADEPRNLAPPSTQPPTSRARETRRLLWRRPAADRGVIPRRVGRP